MADFQCTFAGEYLIYPTQEITKWMDKNCSLDDFRLTVPARNWTGAATDITYPLNDRDDKPNLYKFVYPSGGLMRWGEMWGLVSGTNLADMITAQTDDLILQSAGGADDDTLTFSMTLAAAIPLAEMAFNTGIPGAGRIAQVAEEDETLHLALFVDDRFFKANYSKSSDEELGCEHIWEDVIDSLLVDLGIALSCPAIHSDYGVPSEYSDLVENGQYNAALLLDAALLNVGHQIIRAPAGTYTIEPYASCNTLEENADYDDYTLRSGGDWSRNGRSYYNSTLPATCTFHFPIWEQYERSTGSIGCDPADYPTCGQTQSQYYDWSQDELNDETAGDCGCDCDDNHDTIRKHLRGPLSCDHYYDYVVTKATAFTLNGLTEPQGYSPAASSKIFRMTARAFGHSPQNVAELKRLSEHLAGDFYNRKFWALRSETWNKLVPPSGSGWMTYIYNYGQDVNTKIIGDWANHDVEQFMHDLCNSSSSSSPSSSSSCCCNPFADLPIITAGASPQYILTMDENDCLSWVDIWEYQVLWLGP